MEAEASCAVKTGPALRFGWFDGAESYPYVNLSPVHAAVDGHQTSAAATACSVADQHEDCVHLSPGASAPEVGAPGRLTCG